MERKRKQGVDGRDSPSALHPLHAVSMQYLNKSKNNSGEIHLLELIRSSSISLQPAWAGLEPNYTVALHLTCEDY